MTAQPREPDFVAVRNERGRYEVRWNERFGGGLACLYSDFATEAEAHAWIDGYESGARENM